MEIKNHPSSAKYIIIRNATTDAVALARKIAAGNWARIEKDGSITAHVNYKNEFERIARQAMQQAAATEIAPTVSDIDELTDWLNEHMNSSKIANYILTFHAPVQFFNKNCAGKTAQEIEEMRM